MTNNPLQSLFYQELHQWIKDGCPEHPTFSKYIAICFSYRKWLSDRNKYGVLDTNFLYNELSDELKIAFGSTIFPFNEGLYDFKYECNNRAFYSNPKRLNWISYKASEGIKNVQRT